MTEMKGKGLPDQARTSIERAHQRALLAEHAGEEVAERVFPLVPIDSVSVDSTPTVEGPDGVTVEPSSAAQEFDPMPVPPQAIHDY